MSAAALPIAAGIGALGQVGASFVGKSAQKAALKRTPEEQQLFTQQSGLINQLAGDSRGLTQRSLPLLTGAARYDQRLLSGDRAGLRDLVAPEARSVRDTYKGATAGVNATLQGGDRALALTRLARDRAGSLASLTQGQRGAAAERVGRLGFSTLYPGMQGMGTAVAGGANLLSGEQTRRMQAFGYGAQRNDATSGAIGALLGDMLNYYGAKKKPSSNAGTGLW